MWSNSQPMDQQIPQTHWKWLEPTVYQASLWARAQREVWSGLCLQKCTVERDKETLMHRGWNV